MLTDHLLLAENALKRQGIIFPEFVLPPFEAGESEEKPFLLPSSWNVKRTAPLITLDELRDEFPLPDANPLEELEYAIIDSKRRYAFRQTCLHFKNQDNDKTELFLSFMEALVGVVGRLGLRRIQKVVYDFSGSESVRGGSWELSMGADCKDVGIMDYEEVSTNSDGTRSAFGGFDTDLMNRIELLDTASTIHQWAMNASSLIEKSELTYCKAF